MRQTLKHIRPIRAFGNWYRTQQTLAALSHLHDFELRQRKGAYWLSYDNSHGYQPEGISPVFAFDYSRWAWVIELAGQTVLTERHPLWELIVELRGYLLAYQPGPGDVVLDIGASTGFISAVFAKLVASAGRVICLEPNPADARALRATLALNQVDNCTIVEAALAAFDGTALLAEAGGASRLANDAAARDPAVAVRAISLPTLLSQLPELKPADIRLIKLDVEGAEVDVLEDLLDFLRDYPRAVVNIAAYHPYQGGETHTWIEERCRQRPYVRAKTIFPIHRTTVLVHVDNDAACRRLANLPEYNTWSG